MDNLADPIREAVGLPVGEFGKFVIRDPQDLKYISTDKTPSTDITQYCPWKILYDGTTIQISNTNVYRNYYIIEWLKFLVVHFFNPWGYKLSGIVEVRNENTDRHEFNYLIEIKDTIKIYKGLDTINKLKLDLWKEMK